MKYGKRQCLKGKSHWSRPASRDNDVKKGQYDFIKEKPFVKARMKGSAAVRTSSSGRLKEASKMSKRRSSGISIWLNGG
jgi:hypothetical protein